MTRKDWRCPGCLHVLRDQLEPLPVYDLAHNRVTPVPVCPVCTLPMEIFPQSAAVDLFPGSFDIDVHDGHTNYHRRVSSLHELRAIERESETHARNEPKCTPLVWRDLSQGRSNRTTNVLTDTSYERGRAAPRLPRGGSSTHAGPISVRRVAPE